jgi:hypothetical protein
MKGSSTMTEAKRGRGRPSKYDPSYCDRVIEMGKEGYSVVEMAADIGVHRETLEKEWPAHHEDFSASFAHARQLSQAWWERQGRLGLSADKFNAQLYSRSMAARFPKDWRESKNVAVGGDPDAPAVQVEHGVDAETMAALSKALLDRPQGK